ncbi:M3 family metallopeptidase [Bartonella sp. DGB2]|uniref:M3 family metallopeptidase n=1 Tax=Bartonella sp. DGB2 TaxID=3388426 RepID=UPI00398F98BC
MIATCLPEWHAAAGLPDFTKISDEDYQFILDAALDKAEAAMEALAASHEEPTVENFLLPFEVINVALEKPLLAFWACVGAHTNDKLAEIKAAFMPKLSRYSSKVMMDPRLFTKVEKLYKVVSEAGIDEETAHLLHNMHKSFIRNGAQLSPQDKESLAAIQERLTSLHTRFSENLVKEAAKNLLWFKKEALEGLPDDLVHSMRTLAQTEGKNEHYALRLERSMVAPFMSFAHSRLAREIVLKAWQKRGANGDEYDNCALINEILSLRHKRARLLGYENYAAFSVAENMAKTPEAVYNLLMPIWERAQTKFQEEAMQLQEFMRAEGVNEPLALWDWPYYSEKLRVKRFALDSNVVKTYLSLDQIIAAAFSTANKLFGLSFEEVPAAPLWHQDARLWVVKRADGSLCGHFIGDYFARPSKRQGAWMNVLQTQHKLAGGARPIVYNICNFAKPAAGGPALLSFDDATTLFHEFGHALHGLLSNVTWPSISGPEVVRDFVELPSQLYENWLKTPEVLEVYATHYETGDPMPSVLRDALVEAKKFSAGRDSLQYLGSALLDMALHQREKIDNILDTEREILQGLGSPATLELYHRASHFSHLFSDDGYAAGYYVYMWAEVLEADAFKAFQETGDVFNSEVAQRLETYIYGAGGSRDAQELYSAFRGRMPSPAAMIQSRGL